LKARVFVAGWLTLASCAPAGTPGAHDPHVAAAPGRTPGGGVADPARAARDADADAMRTDAEALHRRSRGAGGEDLEARSVAQFRLAVALHTLGFVNGAYGIFSEIAVDTSHPKYKETLLWLAKIATELPEPADVAERLDRYGDAALARLDNPVQGKLHGEVQYLRGRYWYRNAQYARALAALGRVGAGTPHYPRAQILGGIARVQLRDPAGAVRAFHAALEALDGDGASSDPEPEATRDLAYLSLARTFYSTSILRDDPGAAPVVDGERLAAAMKYWAKVDVRGERWIDALFEQSYAHYMAGDYGRALGDFFVALQTSGLRDAYYPEAYVLRARVYRSSCRFADAAEVARRFVRAYAPVAGDLASLGASLDGNEVGWFRLVRDVRSGRASVHPRSRAALTAALSDRELLRHLDYVRTLEGEQQRLAASPAAFREGPLGLDLADRLDDARALALRTAGDLARKRTARALAELRLHLGDAWALARIPEGRGPDRSVGLAPHVVAARARQDEPWPFDGELWPDEVGTYSELGVSPCRGK
jgi:tetratricopeptide (TPR) repeat protein